MNTFDTRDPKRDPLVVERAPMGGSGRDDQRLQDATGPAVNREELQREHAAQAAPKQDQSAPTLEQLKRADAERQAEQARLQRKEQEEKQEHRR